MNDKRLQLHIADTAKLAPTVKFEGMGTVVIGEYSVIEDNVLLSLGSSPSAKIQIGMRSKVKWGAVLRCYDGIINIGNRTSIGEYSVLTGHGGLHFGDSIIVAGHCYFTAAEHLVNSEVEVRFQGETARGITVENGAWIGAHCTVIDGVRIGEGAVIGAGAVVTRNMPSNYICVGAPCRPIKLRYEG